MWTDLSPRDLREWDEENRKAKEAEEYLAQHPELLKENKEKTK